MVLERGGANDGADGVDVASAATDHLADVVTGERDLHPIGALAFDHGDLDFLRLGDDRLDDVADQVGVVVHVRPRRLPARPPRRWRHSWVAWSAASSPTPWRAGRGRSESHAPCPRDARPSATTP